MSSDPRFVTVHSSHPSPPISLPSLHANVWLVYSKASGSVKDAVGKVEETIGNLTGLDSFKTSGQQRQAEGNVEHKQAQAQGYVEGTKDRAVGTYEKVKGSLTGDTSQELTGWSPFLLIPTLHSFHPC